MQQRHSTKATGRRNSGQDRGNETRNPRDEIIGWLKDAYAMECGLEASLEKQSQNGDLTGFVRERATLHLQETRRHAEEVQGALQLLGSDTSVVKTGMGALAQAAKGIASA